MRCIVCDSKIHWADKCPHKNERSALIVEGSASEGESTEGINIVLINKETDKVEIFAAEASTSAVIDTACTKTVGEKCFENYKSKNSNQEIEIHPSGISYKFGDGRKFQTLFHVTFPVIIAGTHCKISAAIVSENICLFLSKSSLKSVEVLNMTEDKSTIFDNKVILHESTSDHYCIDILPDFLDNDQVESVLVLEANLYHKEKLNQVEKI